jgi:hypothetical protein
LNAIKIKTNFVLKNSRNQGYGGNQKIGYEFAIKNKGIFSMKDVLNIEN